MGNLALVAAGGAIGASLRYGVTQLLGARSEAGFPWATFAANISGAFLLGVLMGALLGRGTGNDGLRLFLGVGVLGGYTTFSTLAFDTVDLFSEGAGAVALTNSLGSLVAGLLAAVAGIVLARALWGVA